MLVIAYHGLTVVLKALKLDMKVKAIWRSNETDKQLHETADELQQHDMILNGPSVMHSVIELKEPLLEY